MFNSLDLVNGNREEEKSVVPVYVSNFDFSRYGFTDEEQETLNLIEEEIIANGKLIARKTLDLGRCLCEMQELMVKINKKEKSFIDWFKSLNLEKNFVYREIKRYKIYEKTMLKQVIEAPVRTIDYIGKNFDELKTEEIEEILENPKIIKEKQIKDAKPKKPTYIIEDYELEDFEMKKGEELTVNGRIRKLKKERKMLLKRLADIEKEIEELETL